MIAFGKWRRWFPRTVGQALLVLVLGDGDDHELVDLSVRCGLHRRQVRRLLGKMERCGLVRRASDCRMAPMAWVVWNRLLLPKAILVLKVHAADGRHKVSGSAHRWVDEQRVSSLGAKT